MQKNWRFKLQKHAGDCKLLICLDNRLYNFNGMVMEWGYLHVRSVFEIISHFVKKLSDELHNHDQELILVAPVSECAVFVNYRLIGV
jgi:hypothetical protein